MNKWIKYVSIGSVGIILISCGGDFLDIKPLSIYTPENVYIDAEGFEGVLVNLRKGLRADFYGQGGGLGAELISSDIAISANKQQDAIHNFDTQVLPTGTGATYDFHEIWDRGFKQIRNANVILARIDNGDFDSEEIKNSIIAEAYFHRAYWYYRFVNLFGDVPFLNNEYTEPKFDFYTHTRGAILQRIKEDMLYAVQWLPKVAVPGAVSQGAGYHLLAKIQLAAMDFEGAIASASAVINSGQYQLMTERFGVDASDPLYNVVWDLHQKENKSSTQNKEGILVVQDRFGFPDAEASGGTKAMRRFVPAWWNNYIKDPEGKRGTIDTRGNEFLVETGRGVGYVRPCSYHNYEIWENAGTDLRHDNKVNWFSVDKFIYNNPASAYYGQPVDIKYTNPIDTIHCWYPFPYYKVYVEDEELPDSPEGGHSDWYVFRLAETYLIRAEAYFWLNQKDKAAADINIVRSRAHAPSISGNDVSIDYILDERARELFAEEFRKSEITRIAFIMAEKGINGYSLDNFSQKNYWYDRVMAKNEFYKADGKILWGPNVYKISPYHVLWPIPANAIDSNTGGIINQNIGYVGCEKNGVPLDKIDDNQ